MVSLKEMASEPEEEHHQYVHEDELNARELALAEADAEALEYIAAGEAEESKVKISAAGVIEIDDYETVQPKVRKPMASRSQAWEHFNKVFDSKGKMKEGLCKYCNRPIQATTSANALLEELGDQEKGKRKAVAASSLAMAKSSKFTNV
ncbi:unnamed protein product [Alopecurus aequalis]